MLNLATMLSITHLPLPATYDQLDSFTNAHELEPQSVHFDAIQPEGSHNYRTYVHNP